MSAPIDEVPEPVQRPAGAVPVAETPHAFPYNGESLIAVASVLFWWSSRFDWMTSQAHASLYSMVTIPLTHYGYNFLPFGQIVSLLIFVGLAAWMIRTLQLRKAQSPGALTPTWVPFLAFIYGAWGWLDCLRLKIAFGHDLIMTSGWAFYFAFLWLALLFIGARRYAASVKAAGLPTERTTDVTPEAQNPHP